MALTDNPMSLVVTGNVTVGATLEASVPTTETRLLSTMDVNTTVTITVPAGVKVLKVTGDVYHEHEGEVALDVYSVNSKKYWLSVYNYEYASDIWYVGVTPNKSYKLYSIWTEYNYGEGEEYLLYNTNNDKYWIDYAIGTIDVETSYASLNFKLEWSPTINSHAVEVTDY